jgi:DnaJ-class molecular chaperone
MITVAIFINGNLIMARSAVNKRCADSMGRVCYSVDGGSHIRHNPGDGYVVLAKKMLDSIVEERQSKKEFIICNYCQGKGYLLAPDDCRDDCPYCKGTGMEEKT